jgi:hypothetical protein
LTGFLGSMVTYHHLTGHDQGLSLLAGRGQTSFDHQFVKALF